MCLFTRSIHPELSVSLPQLYSKRRTVRNTGDLSTKALKATVSVRDEAYDQA
jgi:hypothetical protein